MAQSIDFEKIIDIPPLENTAINRKEEAKDLDENNHILLQRNSYK